MTRLFCITILLFGCSDVETSVEKIVQRSPLLGAERTQESGTGTVAETLTAGSYTYLRLQDDGDWHVVASGEPRVGDRVRYQTYAQISDFESARLNRTFQNLSFTILKKETP